MTTHHHWIAATLLSACAMAAPAQAQQQQQWAAAYIDWRFPEGTADIDRIAQDIAVVEPARASFFTLNWDFTAGDGGYIGLQSDVDGASNVRFSLWNATAARGDACRRFDGEGVGMTCVLPMAIDTDRFYRVRVLRGDANARGQWWSGWIDVVDAAGQTRALKIGDLQVSSDLTAIAPASVYNFNEFWGDAVGACRDVPLSAAVFVAPSVQLGERGARIFASAPVGRRPDGHPCGAGRERTGAAASHVGVAREGNAAMVMVLGGERGANRTFGAQAAASVPALVAPDE
jgi:hypothetical protein